MLKLGRRAFARTELLVMAIVNRTPDSFFDRGATWEDAAAMDRVHQAVDEGADLVDIGGVKAGPGDWVSTTEELRRTIPFIESVRSAYPDLVVSVDTWRHDVAQAACLAGADVLNDAWGGVDPLLAEVAAEHGVALVCTHAGGQAPRTRPHRVAYDDVMADVLRTTVDLAERAVGLGVDPSSILIDPGHDFGKNTWQSLEITNRVDEMVATGWPVLVSTSNKDFIGETLNLPVDQRHAGSLATVAVCAWQGAQVFRVHAVRDTRHVLDMVSTVQGTRAPARVSRGLA